MKSEYSEAQIKKVIWDQFFLHEVSIDGIYGDHITDGNYVFEIKPFDNSITIEELGEKLKELKDSGLFHIYNKGDHYKVVYLNPYVLERKQFSMIYRSINKNII